MSRMAAKIELSPEETDELNRWIKSGKTEQRKVERAKIAPFEWRQTEIKQQPLRDNIAYFLR
jgi:hypothetical protein